MPMEHPVEKPVKSIIYRKVELEIVERPDVLWMGCVDYAANNTDESDICATLERFQGLVKEIEEGTPEDPRELMCPDWSAALSINYTCDDMPCGIMFGNEVYSDRQNGGFDLFTQPGGLWLRVRDGRRATHKLLGKKKIEGLFEYFSALRAAAGANGYQQNPGVPVQVEYHCHAQYGKRHHTSYAYIPITEKEAQ